MNGDEFGEFIKRSVDAFVENMGNLEVERTWREDWMELFLAWSEWQTEVHELYWGKSDHFPSEPE